MDIEGAEYEVLPALMNQNNQPVCISMGFYYHHGGGKLIELLNNRNYDLKIVTDGSNQPMFAEVTATLEYQ
jgi:hypothetical protein